MYRFFVSEKKENKFLLSKEVLNHLKSVRIRKNEKFYCIYNEKFYLCSLNNKNEALIEREEEIYNEWKYNVYLFASIINIKRFEWLIQKAAELGVTHFFPMITKNVNKKYIKIVEDKISRFMEISKNACEQSFRNKIMFIHKPIKFDEAINQKIELKFLAHEQIKDEIETLNSFELKNNIAFYVGPEGGFDELEIQSCKKLNIKIVSLGKRILRSETASIYLLSKVFESN